MAKGAYIGVNGVARKIKKGYVGVGNVARKIKKAYIGVNGVARPFWAGGELVYYGIVSGVQFNNQDGKYFEDVAACSNGTHAIFGGGFKYHANSYGVLDQLEAFNSSFTKTSAKLSEARGQLSTGRLGDYAVFAGGRVVPTLNAASKVVDTYNQSLTRTSPTALDKCSCKMAVANVGNHIIFAGGEYHDDYYPVTQASNFAYGYNKSLTKTSVPNLSSKRAEVSGASVGGQYAVFLGGITSTSSTATAVNVVDVYNQSLTKVTTASSLQVKRALSGSVGSYAVFTGGTFGTYYDSITGTYSPRAYAYDSSLTYSTVNSGLSGYNDTHASATLDRFLYLSNGNTAKSYDESLTCKALYTNKENRYCPKAAAAGNFIIEAGGWYYYNDGYMDYQEPAKWIEAFTIA